MLLRDSDTNRDQEMNSKDKTGVSDPQEHSDRARVSLRQNWHEGGLSKALEGIRGEGGKT